MPEGDNVARHATELRAALQGEEIVSVYGTSGSLRSASARIVGRQVLDVRSHGKNLLIDLDNGWSVRVHLGMTGRWRIGPLVGRPPGDSRLALSTATSTAVCRAAPVVEVGRTPAIEALLARYGPDVLDDDFDTADFLRRARLRDGNRSVAELILDQQVVAGIGNVYKSEALFLERVLPQTKASEVADEDLTRIVLRARALMQPNVSARSRSTTGDRGPGRSTWVYDRADRACRRCETSISSALIADRVTYWCPMCQPDAAPLSRAIRPDSKNSHT